MIIYYAHSMKIYNTKQEAKELKFLKSVFNVPIINPNTDIAHEDSMKPFYKVISKCNIFICSEYISYIGKGVYNELQHAQTEKKIIFCLRKKKLFEIERADIANPRDWAECYAKLIIKEK